MQPLAYSYLRFSSTEQRKGNTVQRQLGDRDAYVARRGLTLDNSFVVEDRGVSAFHGANAATGALRRFLDACKSHRIQPGSYLIVENLDRLSREEILPALSLFLDILQCGVVLVTLYPEQEFTGESLNIGLLVLAIVELSRGHGESLMKSVRSKDNWERRRRNIANEILTSRKPSWIDVVDGKFAVNPVKGAVVRRIFDLAAAGYGIGSIAKLFNREGVPPISKSKHWYDSYVYKVLVNRAAFGEFQPRVLRIDKVAVPGDSGRVQKVKSFQPIGPNIKNYFPPVVGEDTFFKAKLALKSRSRTGGRVSNQVNNLFTGMVHSQAGATYSLRPRNNHLYLVASTVAAGLAKDVPAVPYTAFERIMLKWLREVSIDLNQPAVDLQALEGRKADLEGRITTLKNRIKSTPDLDSVLDVLTELQAEYKQVLQELEVAAVPRTDRLADTRQLLALLDGADKETLETLRRQIKQQIRHLVDKIEVRVEGRPRTKNKRVYCMIRFRTGDTRGVWFQVGSAPADGLWSPNAQFSLDDFDAFMVAAATAAGIDTSKPPPPLTEADWADSEIRRQQLEAAGIDTTGMGYIGGRPLTSRPAPTPATSSERPARKSRRKT